MVLVVNSDSSHEAKLVALVTGANRFFSAILTEFITDWFHFDVHLLCKNSHVFLNSAVSHFPSHENHQFALQFK